MVRILGVNIPDNKCVLIGLTYIYGIGLSLSKAILKQTGIEKDKKISALTPEELTVLLKAFEQYKLEGELRSEVMLHIKRLMDIGSYRGKRHRENRPVRGQRTKTNCRAHKGSRRNVINKKGVKRIQR